MRRKKKASQAGTQLQLFSRQERRKRKSFFKWFCKLWNKTKKPTSEFWKNKENWFV